MKPYVLVVDDEKDIQISMTGILEDEGYAVTAVESGEKALNLLEEEEPDILFLDIWLPGKDGLEILDKVRRDFSDLPVIMISGHGNIETAVETIKKGAIDFIEKPLSLEKVIVTAQKALEIKTLRQENRDLRSRVRLDYVQDLTGESESIQSLRTQIKRVAPTDSWVLITGENGTGKEIVARSIHQKSKRAKKSMIAVNCAAIPDELIESELFGYEKGAFTGANKSHIGKFELAHKGTLFLDEIGDMSLKTQAKILRILEEQSFERLGGEKSINVDVRVIVATNKDLKQEIQKGRFREDLYYRLKVFPLHVPPLRERPEDIPVLLDEFLNSLTQENGFKPIKLTEDALQALKMYNWPGNVRELKNFLERMLIMYAGSQVDVSQLPPEFQDLENVQTQDSNIIEQENGIIDFKEARAEFEKRFLLSKLKQYHGNVSRLAQAIGLERSYLHRKLKAYGLNNI